MATIERLKRRPDFLAAAAGRRFHTDRLTAQVAFATKALTPCVSASRSPSASPRDRAHRIKRRLRAAVARSPQAFPPTVAARIADIVLIARRPALDAAFTTLTGDVAQAIPAVTRPGRRGGGSGIARTRTPPLRGGARPRRLPP